MNTQRSESRRSPTVAESIESTGIRRSRPPTLLERIAMRLGMALIIWGRGRNKIEPDREEQARRYEQRMATRKRENEYVLALALSSIHRW